MIKKTIFLPFLVLIFLSTNLNLNAQEANSYEMWESIMLTPDNTKLKVLSDNMRAHNAKYHKEGAYDAIVYNIVSGPNAGNIIWMMGPMMYKHNDSRPSEGGHDEDWRDKVMPNIKKMHTIEYWRADDKLNNTSMLDGDSSKYPLQFIRYTEVADGQSMSSINMFFKMVSETVKGMEGVNPWGVYYNEFRQGDLGRHIATVGFYKNWTEFDEDNSFKATFDKVHGEENWQAFLDLGDKLFTNSWDEIWSYNAQMSGK
jgi:hypothetical protein